MKNFLHIMQLPLLDQVFEHYRSMGVIGQVEKYVANTSIDQEKVVALYEDLLDNNYEVLQSMLGMACLLNGRHIDKRNTIIIKGPPSVGKSRVFKVAIQEMVKCVLINTTTVGTFKYSELADQYLFAYFDDQSILLDTNEAVEKFKNIIGGQEATIQAKYEKKSTTKPCPIVILTNEESYKIIGVDSPRVHLDAIRERLAFRLEIPTPLPCLQNLVPKRTMNMMLKNI